jgi:penicillin-binding protein 2
MLKPFMNKPVEGMYPPGSTFKIIVALAALESGAIKPGEKIFCPGHWEYGRHLYHCWEKHGHGWMDLAGALQHSCDVYFYQVALRVGIDAVHDMARRLGLGAPVMNLLPREAAGIIPDNAWKEKHTGQRWQHGDTIISGIGQGFVLASCLQLAVMLGRAATNKIITPRMTANPAGQGADEFPALGLKEKNIRLVMGGLEKVMQDGGTASFAAVNVRGARMAGKTGTSQVRSISMKERQEGVRTNEQLPWELRNHGLFVGCAPLGNPKYIVSALIEHSGSSGPAARVAADIMKVLLRREAP